MAEKKVKNMSAKIFREMKGDHIVLMDDVITLKTDGDKRRGTYAKAAYPAPTLAEGRSAAETVADKLSCPIGTAGFLTSPST